jgi:hypothetical protein
MDTSQRAVVSQIHKEMSRNVRLSSPPLNMLANFSRIRLLFLINGAA